VLLLFIFYVLVDNCTFCCYWL